MIDIEDFQEQMFMNVPAVECDRIAAAFGVSTGLLIGYRPQARQIYDCMLADPTYVMRDLLNEMLNGRIRI